MPSNVGSLACKPRFALARYHSVLIGNLDDGASVRKDKQKVLNEVWDDARVRSFLGKTAPSQSGRQLPGDADFYVLRHAYQSMRPEDFARFLNFYAAEGRDVAAKDGQGRTLANVIASHANAMPFIELLHARSDEQRGSG